MHRRHPGDDEGSASLEFLIGGLVLLVPIVYLIVALGVIQTHALGAEAVARHLSRTLATASDADDARTQADRVLSAVAEEYGMDADDIAVQISCEPAGTECPRAGVMIHVEVEVGVALPLVPPVLGLDQAARVDVAASGVQKASRLWGTQ